METCHSAMDVRAARSVKFYREAMEGARDYRHSNSIETEAKGY